MAVALSGIVVAGDHDRFAIYDRLHQTLGGAGEIREARRRGKGTPSKLELLRIMHTRGVDAGEDRVDCWSCARLDGQKAIVDTRRHHATIITRGA